jgi:response regulator NasT
MVKTKIVQEEPETRKKVEKAKGMLMKAQGLSEDAAYNLICRSSMDKRVPMKDIAGAIILASEIKGV